MARQLKFKSEITDDHPVISHLIASLWLRSMVLTMKVSTTSLKRPTNDQSNVADADKQLESMVYRLTQENGKWSFMKPRLENVTDKAKETSPPLIKQVWEFMQNQLEQAERKGLTGIHAKPT